MRIQQAITKTLREIGIICVKVKSLDVDPITDQEWKIIKLVVAIAEPIHTATELLSAEKYLTGSMVYPLIRWIFASVFLVKFLIKYR